MATDKTPDLKTEAFEQTATSIPDAPEAQTTEASPIGPNTHHDALINVNREITKAYDERVYTSNAFYYSSPSHLRAAAHLYNLETVPLENARVLELGCAGGGNLLPFAVAYPNAHVVGVDLSPVQIEQGQQVVQALGLKNLHLKAMSLTDITPETFGQFDYIISHGVFSWVPSEVREAMMRIVRDNLSPNGIAYISYNTYPGWKAGDIVRDAMLLHSHSAQNDQEKLASAKAMLNLLSEGMAHNNALAPSLRAAVAQLREHSDYYIAHEYLETFNNPCYLLEFVNMADQYSLAHVGDADPHAELSTTYGQNVQLHHSLIAMGQPREVRQQYLDFAIGRNFRKSLLVHAARAGHIPMSPDTDKLSDLRWAGHFTEETTEATKQANGKTLAHRTFRNHRGAPVHSNDPTVIRIFNLLSKAWPCSVSFKELTAHITKTQPSLTTEELANKATLDALKTLFRLNSLRYTLVPCPYDNTTEIPDNPEKMSFKTNHPALIAGMIHILPQRANTELGIGGYNLWHETVKLKLHDAEAYLIPHINGQHSRKQLGTLLRNALHQGNVCNTNGQSLKGQRNLDTTAEKIVSKLLDLLKRQALLA